MIIFKRIEYKNFLSVGDNPIEIDLNKNKTTLIVGANGEGKSILLDALSFVLFGKPHRNVNKPQLINSINGKQLRVEVDFSINKDEYKIIRGMSPGIFEIWKNKILINQDSKSRDYQKVLESNILKLNHKSFHQIVVLGSSSFIPFMQLPAQHRREVIEDLLDISIFSKMNLVLRDKKSKLKDSVSIVENELDSINAQIQLQKKHIQEIESITEDNKHRIEEELNLIDVEIEQLKEKNNTLLNEISLLEEVKLDGIQIEKKKLYGYQGNIKSKISNLKNEKNFFKDHDICPTCSQSIADEIKSKMIESAEIKLEEFGKGFEKLNIEIEKAEKVYQEMIDIQNSRNQFFSQIESNNRIIQSKREEKTRKFKFITESKEQENLTQYKEYLLSLITTLNNKQDEKIGLYEMSSYCNIVDELLKDTGIKTKIIRQYLPIMNKLINEHLQTFDFFVSFTLDENFEEKIRSRYRDDFSYASFSEGEKSRIDLALMFTWRQIAKLKNSTNTNLLILDETFDSSLDTDGVDNLLKVLYTLDVDTNTFIISHKTDVLEGRFENKLLFKKKNNFTEMISSSND
jgi:DNA repair exonuclease SbcCD ATPase subunit